MFKFLGWVIFIIILCGFALEYPVIIPIGLVLFLGNWLLK